MRSRGPRMAGALRGTPVPVRLSLAAFVVVLLMTGCVGGSSTSGRPPSSHDGRDARSARDKRFFAPSSVGNRRLSARAPVAPDSNALVAELQRQVRAAGPWIATSNFSVPIVRVGKRQRRVRVKLDTGYPPLQRAFASVPVPRRARPAPGTDRHLV